MGKYKSAVRALADTYNYFDDGFLKKLRSDTNDMIFVDLVRQAAKEKK